MLRIAPDAEGVKIAFVYLTINRCRYDFARMWFLRLSWFCLSLSEYIFFRGKKIIIYFKQIQYFLYTMLLLSMYYRKI